LIASGVLAVGPALWSQTGHASPRNAAPLALAEQSPGERISNIPNLAGSLERVRVENDSQTEMLIPRGFRVRQVARTGRTASPNSDYRWHAEPDGGACFAAPDGGWIYVSNSEVGKEGGGVGALRFDASGEVVDSYSICSGTSTNCAGGPTPWGSWLTCEETDNGIVYECDPFGERAAEPLPALGTFRHEAAAVDPVHGHIYLTEDKPDGKFYRYVPAGRLADGRPDLHKGRLEVLVAKGRDPLQSRAIRWLPLPHAQPFDSTRRKLMQAPTRHQVAAAEKFNGGEGCWFYKGLVYFTTKGDNRVWAVDTRANTIDLVYDQQSDSRLQPGMGDVDNLTVSSGGDVIVAEDGPQMRLVVLGADATPFELLVVLGQSKSELCGPAFNPSGDRLYFSSQNGV